MQFRSALPIQPQTQGELPTFLEHCQLRTYDTTTKFRGRLIFGQATYPKNERIRLYKIAANRNVYPQITQTTTQPAHLPQTKHVCRSPKIITDQFLLPSRQPLFNDEMQSPAQAHKNSSFIASMTTNKLSTYQPKSQKTTKHLHTIDIKKLLNKLELTHFYTYSVNSSRIQQFASILSQVTAENFVTHEKLFKT